MSLDTGPYSLRNVMKTICTLQMRGLGPLSWTMCGQRVSKRYSNPGYLVPRPIVYFIQCGTKKATKRTRQSVTGEVYVVGGYREDDWKPDYSGLSVPFVPLTALMCFLGDVFDGHRP